MAGNVCALHNPKSGVENAFITPVAPHNLNVSGYRRVDNWQQVEKVFLADAKA